MIKDRTMQSLLFVFFIPIHIVKAIRKYISDPELRITHIMTNQNDYFYNFKSFSANYRFSTQIPKQNKSINMLLNPRKNVHITQKH